MEDYVCVRAGCSQPSTLMCGECKLVSYCSQECAVQDYLEHHRFEHHIEMCSNHSVDPTRLETAIYEDGNGYWDYSESYEWDDDPIQGHIPLGSFISNIGELLKARMSRSTARRPTTGGRSAGGGRSYRKRGKGWRKAATRSKDKGLTFGQKAKRRRLPVDTFRKRVLKNPHFYEKDTVRQARLNAAIHGQ